MRKLIWATLSSDGALRCVHPEPSESCSRGLRTSTKPPFTGMWQPAQATLPGSPLLPSVPLVPSLASSSKGPENRGSKKNFWPRAAARGSSAKALVRSAGGRGPLLGRASVAKRALISGVIAIAGGAQASPVSPTQDVEAPLPLPQATAQSAPKQRAARGAF